MKRLPGVTLSPFALGETGMVQDPVTMLIAIDSSRGLSPSRTIGGVPKKRGCQAPFESATPLRQLRQLAERVKFPEKNAGFWSWKPSFGGGGPRSDVCVCVWCV